MADNDKNTPNREPLTAEKDIPPWLQPVPEEEEPVGFLAGKRMWVAAAVAVTVVALFVAVIFSLYDGSSDEAPRHITADTNPIREKPTDPGGMDVPYQDKQVFERANGTQDSSSEVTLAPQPEEPLEALPEEEELADAEDPIGDIAAQVTENAPTAKAETPAPKPQPKAEKKPEATKPTPAKATASTGFKVQLGAYGSEESAEKAWRAVRGKFSNFLSGLSPSYEAVKTGDRTLYRLRVGLLETRAAADEVCLGLRAQQQACIVVNP
ncbi:SPOR domain-containing protein [Kordiimonas sp.]|uniref:SPOR domain-containing protein n=1 Tax=Kordiimonas sp. TaxID=1970157 RepID=UPI003A8E8784